MQHHDEIERLKTLPRYILLLLLLAALTACGSVARVNDNQLAEISKVSEQQKVSGFIVESDGATPVYNATIAILGKKAEQFIQRAENMQPCISPAKPNINFVCSKEDGSFNLDVSQIRDFPVTITIEKEDEIQEIALSENDLKSGLGTIAMISKSSRIKDKVAVVMDFYNPIKEIQKFVSENNGDTQAVALQLMNEYQNLFQISDDNSEVTYPTFYSLFVDADKNGEADIFNYDVVYINSRQQSDISLLDESLRAQLLDYISKGGKLNVTEWTVEMQQEPSLDQYI